MLIVYCTLAGMISAWVIFGLLVMVDFVSGHHMVLKPLIVVGDVVTTGQSVIDAVNAVIEDDIPPIGIISVIDRQDKRNMLTNGRLKFDSLFKHSEFEDFIR
jgi:orotate phosphoribosyltransferase